MNGNEMKTQLCETSAADAERTVSNAGEPVANPAPRHTRPVRLGGLQGELGYDDLTPVTDPDIQWMFYGEDPC